MISFLLYLRMGLLILWKICFDEASVIHYIDSKKIWTELKI